MLPTVTPTASCPFLTHNNLHTIETTVDAQRITHNSSRIHVVGTGLFSLGIVSCSTGDDAAEQPSPSTVTVTTSPPVGKQNNLPSHTRSNPLRLIPPHLKRHPNLHLPIAESRHPVALSPMQLTALHRRAPHTLLGPMKEKATTIPERISVTRCWFSSHKAILNLAPNCCSSTKMNTWDRFRQPTASDQHRGQRHPIHRHLQRLGSFSRIRLPQRRSLQLHRNGKFLLECPQRPTWHHWRIPQPERPSRTSGTCLTRVK